MTTHPPLKKQDGKPKSRFICLTSNPNPDDPRISFINKHLRIVKGHYDDTWNRRLVQKKKWKVCKKDKRLIKIMDIKKTICQHTPETCTFRAIYDRCFVPYHLLNSLNQPHRILRPHSI